MKLQLLLQREDFITIFKNSFSNYLLNNFGWYGEINWISKSNRLKENYFLVNQRLNLIYPCNLDRAFINSLKKEYVYHKNPFRHTLQKLYAKMATFLPLESILSTSVIEINPWLEELENWCILPGNHSIRVINFKKNSCEVFLKKGFNPIFIKNEIKLRSKFVHRSIPKLIDYDIENGHYTEEKIEGLPLNRFINQKQKSIAFRDSFDCLSKLYNKTRNTIDLQEWLCVLIKKFTSIESEVHDNKSDKLWSNVYEIYYKLRSIIERNGNLEISTTITHGDFQPANILRNFKNCNTYLIDWEYSDRRYELYDYFVYCYQTRFPRGLAKRLKNRNLNYEKCNSFSLLFDKFFNNMDKCILAILLFEDLLVRLGEIYVPSNSENNFGLMIFINEVGDFLKHE